MLAAGVDIGLQNAKAVVARDGIPLGRAVVSCGAQSAATVGAVALTEAATSAGVSLKYVAVAATGRGRMYVPGAHQLADSLCLAKAVSSLWRSATVLDIGAEKVLVVTCLNGRPVKIVHNERCAAGSGLFLELVASTLGIPLELSGDLAQRSMQEVEVLSTCAVFAETEIVSHIHSGKRAEDIMKGAFAALARRIYPLLLRAGTAERLVLVGGVSVNAGVVEAIEDLVGQPVTVPPHPETFAALGAALMAQELGSEVCSSPALT